MQFKKSFSKSIFLFVFNVLNCILFSNLFYVTSAKAKGTAQSKAPQKDFTFLKDGKGALIGMLSTQGVTENIDKEGKDLDPINSLAPRGSAALTSSGDLANDGIKFVIHAAPGSMGSVGDVGEPSIASIRLSIANSLRLAEKLKLPSVAIPLVGGGIFLNRLNITKDDLALQIMDEVARLASPVKVVFVAYTDEETGLMQQAHSAKLASIENYSNLRKLWYGLLQILSLRSDFAINTTVVQGSIVDFSVHGCVAIVNAANMELAFGGGLSGVIGKATGQADAIDQVGSKLIEKYRKSSFKK